MSEERGTPSHQRPIDDGTDEIVPLLVVRPRVAGLRVDARGTVERTARVDGKHAVLWIPLDPPQACRHLRPRIDHEESRQD